MKIFVLYFYRHHSKIFASLVSPTLLTAPPRTRKLRAIKFQKTKILLRKN